MVESRFSVNMEEPGVDVMYLCASSSATTLPTREWLLSVWFGMSSSVGVGGELIVEWFSRNNERQIENRLQANDSSMNALERSTMVSVPGLVIQGSGYFLSFISSLVSKKLSSRSCRSLRGLI